MSEYKIKLLNSNEVEPFKEMTYGRYKPFIAWMAAVKGILFPVGLFKNGQAAGLALGIMLREKSPDEVMLLSVFVEKESRRQGWACRMMELLHESARKENMKDVVVFYLSNRPNTPLVNALLAKCAYNPPESEVFACKCDKRLANLSLLEYTQLPPGYETFPWLSLDLSEREKLYKEWKDADWFDPVLSPFDSESEIVPEVSLGLRHGDEIIGWTISHYLGEDAVQYTSLFVRPEERDSAVGVALQMRGLREHLLTDLVKKIPYGVFMVRYDNHARLNVAKRKFAKFSVETYDQLISRKSLSL